MKIVVSAIQVFVHTIAFQKIYIYVDGFRQTIADALVF